MNASTTEFYEWLIRVTTLIRAQQDPQEDQLFDLFVRELGQVLQFDAVSKFDAATNTFHWYTEPCFQELKEELEELYRKRLDQETAESEILSVWVYTHQETVVSGNLDEETRFLATARRLRRAGLQSVCSIPLSDAHHRLGSVLIASAHHDAYSPDDVRFGTLAATQVALAMDDAINFRAAQRARERLELLLDLNNRVVSKLHLRDVLREISANIRRVMECDGVAITLPGPEGRKPCVYALDFPGQGEIGEGWELRAGEATGATTVFQTGEPEILSRDQLEHEPLWLGLGLQSLVHVPLKGESGVVGVLTLATRREGAFAVDDLPFLSQTARQLAIAVKNAMAFGEVTNLKDQVTQEKLYLQDEIRSERQFGDIAFKSESLGRVLRKVETVAPTDSTVLIYGETGTGKELIARAIHDLSPRRSNAFVKVNCAAIPATLLESELFGHERGAFTGAVSQSVGRFEVANHGTIFLDEIGELPFELQPKLLRVLQEREFERLGSTRTLHTDVRLIAATNRDLEALVQEQIFRSDLYYRLAVFPIRIPPLRERPEDIPVLVARYVREFSRRLGKTIDTIPSETMNALLQYPWPGNVRELQNVLERAAILTPGPVLRISSEDLRLPDRAPVSPPALQTGPSPRGRPVSDEAERQRILRALEQADGIVAGPNGAAALLGIKRSTLQGRMQRLGIHISRRAA